MTFIGALVATLVMTMMILFGDKMGLMPPGYNMLTDGLGAMMNRMMGFIPKEMGYVVHLIIGLGVHPWLYALVFEAFLPGIFGGIVFALIFGVIMVMMLPMMNAPAEYRMKMIMGILMAHVVYGALFVAF